MSSAQILNLNTLDYPFETLVQRAKSQPPKLILNPDFQRKYKWDKEGWARASKFIESCLMRIPLPSCYFAETSEGNHLVIDGVQRITTILKFFNDDFALEEMNAFPELEGKKFSELGVLRSELESTTIRCVVLRRENPEELITEIFARLNQGAVTLSDQEIRHALYSGPFDKLLQELSKNEIIKKFKAGKDDKDYSDGREGEELVLRFFAFHESSETYEGSLSKFLDKYMKEATSFDDSKIEHLRQEFENSIKSCLIIFDEQELFTNISRERPRQSIVFYDLLMSSLGKISKDVLVAKREEIREAFIELCQSEDFRRSIAGGLQRKSSINTRNADWTKKLQDATRV
ncbi:UNVERIFIED_ORG: uncharacterized protein with ParB-like and HNH nuclease domain [Agrobacterium larrymoorei]|nr:uncharacterized protein with ParB-like and HNH nuclease domain [Agrobacterium larrymoorei]